MQELEKILEEIRRVGSIRFANFIEPVISVGEVEKIIRKHMNDGWIPVEERLPELNEDGISEDVLVSFSDSYSICVGFYDFNKKRWYVHGTCPYIGRLMAWRPLPERYHQGRSVEE